MSGTGEKLRSLSLAFLMVLSVVAGTVAFSGAAAAANNVSISPDDNDAGASSVTYTAEGDVEISNDDTLQHFDVHLGPADASDVTDNQVSLYIDGDEYTDGWSVFDSSGGTIEIELSNSRTISDGDTVRVVVEGVTNPSSDFNAEVTLHDSGDAKWQTFSDSVAIDTPPSVSNYAVTNPTGRDVAISFDSSKQLSEIAVNITDGSGATVATLTEGDFSETEQADGTWLYEHTYTTSQDGDYDVTLTKAADADGDDAASGQTGSVQINTKTVSIAGGSADPSQVTPGTTVNNQEVSVTFSDVSADGNTDKYFVEFDDQLADGLSVNSANVNGTASIAQSAELVDGFDGDGVAETVRFQTDTDAGGTVPLEITVDVSVNYPDTESTYPVDARIEDSDGDTDTSNGVVSLQTATSTSPIITDYSVNNPSGETVSVSFNSSKELSNITVDLSDSSGTVTTLTEGDFTGTNQSGTWTYEATYTVSGDGQYTATLNEAVGVDDNDGASGESDTVTIESTPAQIVDGSATPSQVAPGSTVNNQKVNVVVADVSADGDTDWHYVEFDNALASGLSVNSASANATSITSSAELVEGYDNDGVDDTIKFATSADGGGDVDLELTVDASVDYPSSEASYSIDAQTEDSSGVTTTQSGVASITASTTNIISGFTADSPSGRDVAVSFDASEKLDTVTVELTNESGATVATLTKSDFTETSSGGTYTYEATTTVAGDGVYTATVTDATDADGNDAGAGNSDTATVDTTPARILGGNASPDWAAPGETINNQQVSVVLSGVSADGDTDWHYVEFPNALAANLSVNSASANATSITSSANLVDGYDNDSVADTVRFATSSDASGEIDLTVTVDVAISPYPNTETTYSVGSRVVDSQTGATTESDVASIQVVEPLNDPSSDPPDDDNPTDDNSTDDNETELSPPSVNNFDLVANDDDVDATVTMSAPVDELRVDVDGTVDTDLTRSAFSVSQRNGNYVYEADVSSGTAGTFEATLEVAANATGDAASNQTDSVTVELPDDVETGTVASPPWVGAGDSTHTLTVQVPEVASVTNETLSSVTVGYSEAFRNASGSVTSVSDSQNVVALTVVSANGTVKSQMGDTDAVSVNVVSGEVRLDLSDVDSSRKAELAPGDRVTVRIQPVTNPATAGTYQTDIGLHSAAGHSTEVSASVDIKAMPDADVADTATVGPNDEQATLNLSESGVVETLTIGADVNDSGVVSATIPDEQPAAVDEAPGSVVTTLNITRPDAVEDQSTNVTLTLSADALESNASDVVISRYDEESGNWTQFNTTVVAQSGGTVTVEAHISHTSMFAVSSVDDSDQQQQDPSDDTTPTPPVDPGTTTPSDPSGGDTDDTTDTAGDSGPGFGVAVAIVALLGAAMLALRRRD